MRRFVVLITQFEVIDSSASRARTGKHEWARSCNMFAAPVRFRMNTTQERSNSSDTNVDRETICSTIKKQCGGGMCQSAGEHCWYACTLDVGDSGTVKSKIVTLLSSNWPLLLLYFVWALLFRVWGAPTCKWSPKVPVFGHFDASYYVTYYFIPAWN
jgi:hypothetical protein